MTKEIPPALSSAALACDDVALTRRAIALGLTKAQGRRLAKDSRASGIPRGVLLVPPVRDLLRSRARAAQLLVPHGILCGTTAARLLDMQGLAFFTADEPIHLQLPNTKTRWQRGGLELHWTRRPILDVVDCGGLRVGGAEHTLMLLEATVDRPTFIALADSAAHQGLVEPAWLAERQAAEAGRTDERTWRLVDGRSESPSESRVRVVLHDGGLPPADLQIQVRDETGRIIARLDLGWRRQRVGLEVDSAEHDKPTAVYRDRYRQNDLLELGWDIRRVTGWDAQHRPAYVQRVVRTALGV